MMRWSYMPLHTPKFSTDVSCWIVYKNDLEVVENGEADAIP